MKKTSAFAMALPRSSLPYPILLVPSPVPPGVALSASQEITRQVPAEVESLDPAHIESWTGNTVGLVCSKD